MVERVAVRVPEGGAIHTTSASLLERLKLPVAARGDWQRLNDIYLPLIHVWLGRLSVHGADADDLSQEVWLVLLKGLIRFERERDGSFRAWLRQITVNQVRNWRRKRRPTAADDAALSQLEDPHSLLSRQWDDDHDRHVFGRLLEAVRPDFALATWELFRRFALDGEPAAVVAGEFGATEAAVVQAKARVLRRLREEAGGLLD